MTPQDAARILSPIQLGFLSARLRLRELREEAETQTGSTAYRAVADLAEAEEFLIARERQWDFAGLLSSIDAGYRVCTWPNVIPDAEAMAATVDAWTEGKPELRARVAELQAPPAVQLFRRLASPMRKAAGAMALALVLLGSMACRAPKPTHKAAMASREVCRGCGKPYSDGCRCWSTLRDCR